MKLSHFFLPHPETHKKAHLISWQGILAYAFLFLALQFGFTVINKLQPGVLGISSNISHEEVIRLTNIERQKMGISPVTEDPRLSEAAAKKAANMYEENYWSHYSPSGKDPWGFILSSGYKFSYAGENLARNFYTPTEVVQAWMDSPTHRDNLLNPKYQHIGIAVSEGMLNGQKTVLIVQEFGSPIDYVASVDNAKTPSTLSDVQSAQRNTLPATTTNFAAKGSIDPYFISKIFGLSLIAFMSVLLLIDLFIIRRRAVYRLSSRHLPHFALLSIAASVIANTNPGSIL